MVPHKHFGDVEELFIQRRHVVQAGLLQSHANLDRD